MSEQDAVDCYFIQIEGMNIYCNGIEKVLDKHKDEIENAELNLKNCEKKAK